MNEKEFEGLMKEYGDALGTSARTPRTKTPPVLWPKRLGYASILMTAMAVGVVTMLPRDAAARKLQRLNNAIKNAQTMERTLSRLRPDGTAVEVLHVYYMDGMWRTDVQKSAALAMSLIVKGGDVIVDHKKLPHATIERATKDVIFADGNPDALEYVKDALNSGRADIERTVEIRDHENVDGRQTYEVVLDRAEDQYHAEILIEKASDLPISADVKVHYGGENGGQMHFREEYRFNHTIERRLFAPDPRKPVVDMAREAKKLGESWRVLGAIGDCQVRDGSVTPDGTIWIAITRPEMDDVATLPTTITCSNGATYFRIFDLPSSAVYSNAGDIKVDDQEVLVVGFAPVDTSVVRPTWAVAHFAKRPLTWPNASPPVSPEGDPTDQSVRLSLRVEAGSLPSYFTALNLDHIGFQIPLRIWQQRAETLEKAGKLEAAIAAYEACAKAYAGFVKYAGYRPLESAAALYDRLGRTADAAKTRQRAAALRASRER